MEAHFHIFYILLWGSHVIADLDLPLQGPEYEEICRISKGKNSEKELCPKIREVDGSWTEPDPVYLKTLKILDADFTEAAKRMGVEPLAVKASFATENSLNVTTYADEKAFLRSLMGTKYADEASKAVRGTPFSYGIGAIKPDSAMEVEPGLARMYGRPERNEDGVIEALENPQEAIKYGTAILSRCQKAYKDNGIDLSKNIPALATLYNVGDCQEKARAAGEALRRGKYEPKLNYFGYFVKNWLPDIEQKTKGSPKPADRFPASLGKMVRVPTLRNQIPLAAAPPDCGSDLPGFRGKLHRYNQYENLNFGQSVGTASSGEYKILTAEPDCNGDEWDLIRTKDGQVGWTSRKTLEPASQDRLRPANSQVAKCQQSQRAKCIEEINNIKDFAAQNPVLGDDGQGFVEIRLSSRRPEGSEPLDYDQYSAGLCLSEFKGPKPAPFSYFKPSTWFPKKKKDVVVSELPECNYDPFKTMKRMEQVLALPCVDAVFAPNRVLINHFSGEPGRVFLKYFEHKDRFAIRVRENCDQNPTEATMPKSREPQQGGHQQ
ncbi:MAG: hypothetical protein C5B49_01110 [Bdellovibrio sp.]|nr:MAG: hypothetical protein C5B49_01110 [Bdellovibrio sp.]